MLWESSNSVQQINAQNPAGSQLLGSSQFHQFLRQYQTLEFLSVGNTFGISKSAWFGSAYFGIQVEIFPQCLFSGNYFENQKNWQFWEESNIGDTCPADATDS